MHRTIPKLFFLFLLPGSLPAQDSWTDLAPLVNPGPRYQHAMAYDAARQRIVLFGGRTKQTILDDTWEFDGQQWLKMNPPNPPPGVSLDPKMTYDSQRKKIVMLRLESATSLLLVWEFDGVDWQSYARTNAPRNDPFSIAYDEARKVTVLFKDGSNPTASPETWEWDGNDWRQRSPSQHPPGVINNAMAYDPVRRKVIHYGGYSTGGGSTASTDTYEWDGALGEWNKLSTGAPPSRSNHALASDGAHNRIILFGGYYPFSPKKYRPGTWQWDGMGWSQLSSTSSPPMRHSYGAAMDPQGRVIIYGGVMDSTIYGDTWAFQSSPGAAFEHVGPGCPGSHQKVPSLAVQSLPVLGNSFVCDIQDAPPSAPGAFFLGVQNPNLDLAGLGAPGCIVLTSFDGVFPASANPSGNLLAPVVIGIPLDPVLAGGAFYCQAVFVDKGANQLGVVTSSGGKGAVGY